MLPFVQMRSIAHDTATFAILVVEDNQGDIRLVREAVAAMGGTIRLSVARDGLQALRMLQESRRLPDLVLLDLKLPSMDGSCLLSLIKADPALRRIPVVVLTSSTSPGDVRQAYDLHANCYLVKPPRLGEFLELIRTTIEFWTTAVRLPGS